MVNNHNLVAFHWAYNHNLVTVHFAEQTSIFFLFNQRSILVCSKAWFCWTLSLHCCFKIIFKYMYASSSAFQSSLLDHCKIFQNTHMLQYLYMHHGIMGIPKLKITLKFLIQSCTSEHVSSEPEYGSNHLRN